MGFPTRLKCNKGQDRQRKDVEGDHQEKLSERAVMKEDGLRWVYLQERRLTP